MMIMMTPWRHDAMTIVVASPRWDASAQGIDAQAHCSWKFGAPDGPEDLGTWAPAATWAGTPIALEKRQWIRWPFHPSLVWNFGCLRISWPGLHLFKWTSTRENNELRDPPFAQASATIHLWPWTRVRHLYPSNDSLVAMSSDAYYTWIHVHIDTIFHSK